MQRLALVALGHVDPKGFQAVLVVKSPPVNEENLEMRIQSLGREDPLEEGTATHSSILACGFPWTEEPGGLRFRGSQRVGHN